MSNVKEYCFDEMCDLSSEYTKELCKIILNKNEEPNIHITTEIKED